MDNECKMCGGFGMLIVNPETGYLELPAGCEVCGKIGPDVSGEEVPECKECEENDNV